MLVVRWTISLVLVSAVFAAVPSGLLVANAQSFSNFPSMQNVQQITGKYVNSNAKLEITLPSGWNGIVFQSSSQNATMVRASPDNFTLNQGRMMVTSMTIRIITKNSTQDNTIPRFGQGQTRFNISCNQTNAHPETINGMNSIVTTSECTSAFSAFTTKTYWFQTADKFISPAFTARSSTDYERYVGAFDNSVNTLTIASTIGAPTMVVPEFPLSLLGALLALIGTVAFLGRSRYSSLFGKNPT